jgi:hypothetical protein
VRHSTDTHTRAHSSATHVHTTRTRTLCHGKPATPNKFSKFAHGITNNNTDDMSSCVALGTMLTNCTPVSARTTQDISTNISQLDE